MNMEKKVILIALILFVLRFVFLFFDKNAKGELVKKLNKEILDWINTGLSALFFAFLIMYFIVQAFKIPSGSMLNTLLIKDHLFVNKFIYGMRLPIPAKDVNKHLKIEMKRVLKISNPKRGDIVVFVFPEDRSKDFIKRCVGVPGDKIEIVDKVLYVNDKKQDEPYVIHTDAITYPNDPFLPENFRKRDNFGPIIVPAGHYFMMGDNRDSSYDSRYWGALPSDFIKGKALVIYWPLNRIRLIK
jgi:signal peptidase I